MTSEVLSLIFSLIGCITGIISLSISILYFIYQKPNVSVEFEPQPNFMYFDKLRGYTYNCKHQAFGKIRLINKSDKPITVSSILILQRIKGKQFIEITNCGHVINKPFYIENKHHIKIFINSSVQLPLRIEPYDIYEATLFFPFFPDDYDESEKCALRIITSRNTIDKRIVFSNFYDYYQKPYNGKSTRYD